MKKKKNCLYCGEKNEENARYCACCGRKQIVDMEMVNAARENNQQAITDIYMLSQQNVYFTVRSMVKDEDTIADIVQDTFIKVFDNLGMVEFDEEKFQAWVRRIAHNMTIDYLRKKRETLFSELERDDSDGNVEFEDDRVEYLPEAVIDRKETSYLINEMLDVLSEDQRLAVGMFYYEQYSVKEIADTLGVSENTIKSRLNYARKKIEQKVKELENKGTKLYGLSPIPFLLLLFKNQDSQATAPNAAVAGKTVGAIVAEKSVAGVTEGNIATTVTRQISATTSQMSTVTGQKTDIAGNTVSEIHSAVLTGKAVTTAGKGIATKVAAAILAVTLIGGGVYYAATNTSYLDTMNSVIKAATESMDTYKDKTISEIIYGEEISIWYHCDSINKDSIPTVYVMYGNGTYISASEYTLGELAKMTDEEIISWVEDVSIVDAYYTLYSDEVYSIIEELGYGDLIYEDDDEKYYKTSVSAYDFNSWVDDYFVLYDFFGEEYCDEEFASVAQAEGKTLFEYLASIYGREITSYEIYAADICFSGATGYDYMDLYERAEKAAAMYNEKAQEGVEALKKELKNRVDKSGTFPAYQCVLSLTTDGTGNSVSAEVIYFETGIEFATESTYSSSKEISASTLSIVSSDKYVGSGVVYESIYSGRMAGYLYYTYMLLRVDDEDTLYQIDEIGTDGVLVDEAVTFD